jgi:hypothetical protein
VPPIATIEARKPAIAGVIIKACTCWQTFCLPCDKLVSQGYDLRIRGFDVKFGPDKFVQQLPFAE